MTEQTDVRELREWLEGFADDIDDALERGKYVEAIEDDADLIRDAAAALERLEKLEAAMADPTYDQSGEACMWFRHDFGLMNGKDREDLRWQAREWIRAWRKTLVPAPADRTGGADA